MKRVWLVAEYTANSCSSKYLISYELRSALSKRFQEIRSSYEPREVAFNKCIRSHRSSLFSTRAHFIFHHFFIHV